MIRRYFFIFAASLFILITPTTGVKANIDDPKLEELARRTNSPPDGINYQAVLRDDKGKVLDESAVTLRFTLSNTSGNVWVETHTKTTDVYGLVTLIIGNGTKTGGSATAFAAIDWENDVSVQVEVDAGSGFVNLGTSALQSVPYANHAKNGLTAAQSTKLDAIDLDAEVNVQTDWAVTDNTSDAFVKNKPAIPSDIKELTDTDGLLNGSSFDGAFGSLTGVPVNLDTDATDDFDGAFGSLSGVPTNLDTDATDDFSGSYNDLADVPTNIDTDATDDFSGSFTDLTDVPSDLADGDDVGPSFAGSGTDSFVAGASSNLATGNYSMVGGGRNNVAGELAVTVSGGRNNQTNSHYATIGGGGFNSIDGIFSTIGGGRTNSATAQYSFIGGGKNNSSSKIYSTISGGVNNTASGIYSSVGGGRNVNAQSFAEFAIGQFTEDAVSPDPYTFAASDRIFTIGNGTGVGSESNAMVILKNGNTTLNGQLTIDADNIGGSAGFTLPGQDGTAGQVLSTDGSGAVSWGDPAGGGAFTLASNLVSAGDADDDFLFGSAQLADAGNAAEDNRMFFDKSNAAFRVGKATSTQWDNPTAYSFSSGFNNEVGYLSFIGGGYRNVSSSASSTSIGGGQYNTISTSFSHIGGGSGNTASGVHSTIGGGGTNNAQATFGTIAGGFTNTVSGNFSTVAGGRNVSAEALAEFAVGHYSQNAVSPNPTTFVSTDRIFTIGNGTSGAARSNALVILKNGNTTLNGQLTIDADNTGGSDGFTLPGQDGTAGQVLSTDGSGAVSWGDPAGGGAFTLASNLVSAGDADDDFLFGSAQLADAGNTSEDKRIFFDKSSGAFRAGGAQATQWDSPGNYSFAVGRNNNATGYMSTIAGGTDNVASGEKTAIGGGLGNAVSSYYTTVGGGRQNAASYRYATISGGKSNSASGYSSVISGGSDNIASATLATIGGGQRNTAAGTVSTVGGGREVDAQAFGEFATGLYTAYATSPNATTFIATDRIFTIGNGTSNAARSNAIEVFKNGNTNIHGQLTIDADNVGGSAGFTLPGQDGTAGQVLSTDGSGSVTWQTASGGGGGYAGAGTDSFLAGYSGNSATGIGATVGGGGAATATNNAVGDFSTIAGGYNNSADGEYSSVGGGAGNSATVYQSTVGGGGSNIASGDLSTISGGFGSNATANYATVGGGYENNANGNSSTIPGGIGLVANSFGEMAVGVYNEDIVATSASTFDASDQLFVVGNGTSDIARSNAFTILKNGNATLNGQLTLSDGANPITLPNTDGTIGQVLQTDGSGNVTWQTAGGGNYAGGGTDSFVAGAASNSAAGSRSTIGGGSYNTSSGSLSTVGGGQSNSASNVASTVAGGRNNTASGVNSTVGGGNRVHAESLGEFAIGLYSTYAATPAAGSFVSTDRILTVGNGTGVGASRSDALIILKNGNATFAGTVSENSDRRLKREIQPLGETLSKVNEMEGVIYKWNDLTPRDTAEINIGLIAQEVEKLFPELVTTGDNGYKSVNYIHLVPVLIEAIKELTLENNQMEAKQERDEERFAKLENQMNLVLKLMGADKESLGKK